MMTEIQNMVEIHYSNSRGVEGTCVKYPEVAAKVIEEWPAQGFTIISVRDVPWCGWRNPWTDSGDRGAAAADHKRYCEVCE